MLASHKIFHILAAVSNEPWLWNLFGGVIFHPRDINADGVAYFPPNSQDRSAFSSGTRFGS